MGCSGALYDANDRLAAVCYVPLGSCAGPSTATQAWTYDLNGNRKTEKNGTGTGATTTYTYDAADQLTSRVTGTAAAIASTFDADGNTLTDGTTSSVYDLKNRVKSSTEATITTAWQRDGDGNATSRTTGTTVTPYTWDTNNDVPQLASDGTVRYHYDPLGRVTTLTSGTTTQTASHDPLGAPTDLITNTGAIARSTDWTPFGTVRTATGAPAPTGLTSTVSYAGMATTGTTTGSYLTRDRIYASTTGRWTARDPLTPPVGNPFDTTYSYAANAPTMYVDPLGDFPRPSLQQISDFSAGFGDTITFGLTARARVALGAEGVVQHNSKAYGGGTVTGFAAGAAVTGGFGASAARIAAGGGARGLAAAGAVDALVSGSNYAMNRAAIGATICPTNLTLALAAGAAAPGLATAGGRIASRLGGTRAAAGRSFAGAPLSAEQSVNSAAPSAFTRAEALSGRASSRTVNDIADSMRVDGWQGAPIDVVELQGQKIVVDGHHRLAAARRAGIDAQYKVVSPSSVIGPGQYTSIDDILKSSYSVGRDRLR